MAKRNVEAVEGYTILFVDEDGYGASTSLALYNTKEEAIEVAEGTLRDIGEVGGAIVCSLKAVFNVDAVPTIEIQKSEAKA